MITNSQRQILEAVLEAATDDWGQTSPDMVYEVINEFLEPEEVKS